MKDTNKEKNQANQEYGLYIVVAILLAIAIQKFVAPPLLSFWVAHKTGLTVVAIVGSLMTILLAVATLWNRYVDHCAEKAITARDDSAVLLGRDEHNKDVYLKQALRTMHTLVIGTTGVGKTASVILPAVVQDIKNGSGVLIIDGKADNSLLEQVSAWAHKCGRPSDVRIFSLAHVGKSATFNPLVGGSPLEVVERVFSSFKFENEYYRNVQFKMFLRLVTLLSAQGRVPTMALVQKLLNSVDDLRVWFDGCDDVALKQELTSFADQSAEERFKKISGLDASLSHFSSGNHAILFNQEKPLIDFDDVLANNRIVYFQLPTMYYPFLAEVTGKLVLQTFQSAVAKRHLGLTAEPKFFCCYLDDFQDYIYPGFGALLNKSRSANIGVVFSHQALGDLDKVGPGFRNTVLTNTNIKVVMRNADPDTCDYFSRSFGTRTTEKVTERRKRQLFSEQKTGDGSVRDVEEFLYHPNDIKQLGTGAAVVSIPHPKGVKTIKIQCLIRPGLPPIPLDYVDKTPLDLFKAVVPPKLQDVIKHKV